MYMIGPLQSDQVNMISICVCEKNFWGQTVILIFFQRFIMVPYYPWKLSHKHHHKNTGNIDKEEIFYPIRENCEAKKDDRHKLLPLFGLGFGWFYYLIKGTVG